MTDITPAPEAVTPEAVAAQARSTAEKGASSYGSDWLPAHVCKLLMEAADRLEALAADLAAQKARADAAERQRDELVAALDTLESDAGITANGNMWRFWAQMARDEAKQAKAANVARKATEAKVAKLVEALRINSAILDAERSRMGGEPFTGKWSFADIEGRYTVSEAIELSRAIIAEVQG